ncbi:hypothetical protein [Candidatus Uabimicrobium amorphum]|uniref:DUF3592 domain-containing protein n=1 Tax=Uabimicrobium amorphum TaxID=2596890 RepID=A0A5S9IMV2_UABAM|nr:hypothetical protein [Candidatus Uabimicrobium amorphum]BBM84624.1 hypothetical protein UABAM_02985 [Candidatus Uabimicrobium amorphum]
MQNNFVGVIFFIYILTLLTIFLYGWSKHQQQHYFETNGDKSSAVITKKNHIKDTYVVEYLYHDNITQQGYADFKIVSANMWNGVEVGDKLLVVYDKTHPTHNIFKFTSEDQQPFLEALKLILALIVPVIYFYILTKVLFNQIEFISTQRGIG